MFVNFSNHPMDRWGEEQLAAARSYGETAEAPFPAVPSMATEEEIRVLAQKSVEKIMQFAPDVVMCQGEFTVAFEVVRLLQKRGVTCVSACSERQTVESIQDGVIKKESIFVFRKFRRYSEL